MMSRMITLFLMIVADSVSLAQGTSNSQMLKRINTIGQAELLLEKLDPKKGAIGRFNSVIDSVEYKEITRDYKIGDVFFGRKLTYKILDKEKEVIFRCQYIHLDGNLYSREQADSIRRSLIFSYQSGTAFEKLVAQNPSATPGKKGGDSFWFHREKLGEEICKALESHTKGEVFMVNDPGTNSYYLVQKSHNEIQADSWVYIRLR